MFGESCKRSSFDVGMALSLAANDRAALAAQARDSAATARRPSYGFILCAARARDPRVDMAQLRLGKRDRPSRLHPRISQQGEGDARVKAGGAEEKRSGGWLDSELSWQVQESRGYYGRQSSVIRSLGSLGDRFPTHRSSRGGLYSVLLPQPIVTEPQSANPAEMNLALRTFGPILGHANPVVPVVPMNCPTGSGLDDRCLVCSFFLETRPSPGADRPRAARVYLWALSPPSYLSALTTNPVESRTRRGRCRFGPPAASTCSGHKAANPWESASWRLSP